MPRRRRHNMRKRHTASEAWKLAKKAWNSTDHETSILFKAIDNTNMQIATDALLLPSYLSGIAQGNELTERRGEKVQMKFLTLRLDVIRDPASGTVRDLLKFQLIYDKQAVNDFFTYDEVFVIGTNNANNVQAVQDPDSKSRFVILKTRYIVLDDLHPAKRFDMSMPINKKAWYSGTTNGILSCTRGLFLMAVTSSAADPPDYRFVGQLTFNA